MASPCHARRRAGRRSRQELGFRRERKQGAGLPIVFFLGVAEKPEVTKWGAHVWGRVQLEFKDEGQSRTVGEHEGLWATMARKLLGKVTVASRGVRLGEY